MSLTRLSLLASIGIGFVSCAPQYNHHHDDDNDCHGTAQCGSWSTTVGREYEVDYELHMNDHTYKGDCVHGHSSTENVVANNYADCETPCYGHRSYECACVSAEFAHEAHSDKRTIVSDASPLW